MITFSFYFQNGPVKVTPNDSAPQSQTNEGLIQTVMISINGEIAAVDPIYVALWAVNGVGFYNFVNLIYETELR